MNGRLALVGGDEFRAGCEAMDAAIIAASGKASPVALIVPTAAAFENPARAADNGARHFAALGADAAPLMALNRQDAADPAIAAEIDAADIVYFTGGNPAHLLDALRESALLAAVRRGLSRGMILAGSSAGAMVLGSHMRFRGAWTPALGLAGNLAILPHHERADPAAAFADLWKSAPANLAAAVGVDGRTGIIREPAAGAWRVLGAGRATIYRRERWERAESGDAFAID